MSSIRVLFQGDRATREVLTSLQETKVGRGPIWRPLWRRKRRRRIKRVRRRRVQRGRRQDRRKERRAGQARPENAIFPSISPLSHLPGYPRMEKNVKPHFDDRAPLRLPGRDGKRENL